MAYLCTRMRAFLDRHTWITYLVVGVFVLATSGAALSRMTCLDGGHSVLSFGLATDCCPPDEEYGDAPMFKADCCELATVQAESDNYLPHEVLQVAVAEVAVAFHLPQEVALVPAPRCGWLCSRPPPLSTAERLAVLSVQRV